MNKLKRIYLEINKNCNLSCPFCISRNLDQRLSLDQILKIIEKIKDYTDYIYLHVLGEPLLHPDIDDILAMLDRSGLKLILVSNGTLLGKHPDLLEHSCLYKLAISIHSIDSVAVSEDYFKNIDELIRDNHNKNIELRFYGDIHNNALHYLEHLKENYVFEETSKKDSFKIADKVYVYTQKMFKWPSLDDPYLGEKGRCLGAISQLAILANGDVVLCCLDPYGHTKIGNVLEQDFKDIIDSDLYRETIKKLRNNILSFELCKHCTYRKRFDQTSFSNMS